MSPLRCVRPRAAFAFLPLVVATPHAFGQAAAEPARLAPVVVTGRAPDAAAAPAAAIGGDALTLKRGVSIGETLDGLPGVASTAVGPNASRPVLRGLDGDRARILGNGGTSFDASALGFDHAVPIDPLAVERIEVLRGPAALRYGGHPVGGVVDAIDNRIPRSGQHGAGGAAEVRLGGAASERGGAALVEAGDGRIAWHADAFGRATSDLRVPRHVPVDDGVALAPTTRVRNSASRTSGGAVGAALTTDRGYLGAAVDTYDSRYGSVAEPDVTLAMRRDHLAVAGATRGLAGFVRAVRGRVDRTVYRHKEIDGVGDVGTTFAARGTEARLEAEHAPVGGIGGWIGAQVEDSAFSALGDEAFVPGTRTRRRALFAIEELRWSGGTSSAGLRLERATIDSDGDAGGAVPRFGGARQRGFALRSVSLAHAAPLAAEWKLTAGASHAERAPTFYELYANGLHVATGAFETGDATLAKERSDGVDLAVQWQRGADRARVGVHATRHANYIALEATGGTAFDGNGVDRPVYAFRGVRARLEGVEIEGRRRIVDAPWTWDATAKVDVVRGTNLDSGEPLPRLPPLRALVGVEASGGPSWHARVELDHAARQNRVPSADRPTAGHTRVNLSLACSTTAGAVRMLAFVRLDNAFDTLAYSASTIRTVRDLAPLPGRSLRAGVRVSF